MLTVTRLTLIAGTMAGCLAAGVSNGEAATTHHTTATRADRLESLADRNASIDRREQRFTASLDRDLKQGQAGEAEAMTDRLHALQAWDSRVLANAHAVTDRIATATDTASRPKLEQRVTEINHKIGASRSVDRREREIDARVDKRLDEGFAGHGTQRIADRLTHETHHGEAVAGYIDHSTDQVVARVD